MKLSLRIVVAVLGLFDAGLLHAESDTNTEVRVLPRTRPDRLYQLTIALPPSFRTHPERKYPVILVAEGYWGLQTVRDICGGLNYGKHLPEALVVGLDYAGENLNYVALRFDDLSPVAFAHQPDNGGHADRFLDLIETQMLPLLEREYRADPEHRYLLGTSGGGLFALYALFTKPDLFQGVVADSPTVDGAWNLEREFAASGRTTEARVFMSFAENEASYYAKQIRVFHGRMAAHNYVKGGLELRRIDRVRHSAGASESYMQGLLFVTAPIAPEHGIQTDMYTDPDGRTGYLLSFWPTPQWAAMPEADRAQLWRAHTAYLAGLPATKPAGIAVVSPSDSTRHDSGAVVFAAERSEAVAMAAADPAVKTGILTYEVLPEADN